jgi:hypothetical protein
VKRHLVSLAAFAVAAGAVVLAQGPRADTRSARESALIDITGQWVSIINEDWRWRMVTPPKGDTSSVPLNPAGRKAADAWDLNADRARGALCKAFGPPALIRQPGRVRIRWESADTLGLEFDADVFGAFAPRPSPARGRCRGTRGSDGSGSRRTAASSRRVRPTRRVARGGHDEPAGGLSPPQRCAAQRSCGVKEFSTASAGRRGTG